MPRLLAFLPCERAIISKDDETVSLITIAQGLSLVIPSEVIGQNIMLPHNLTFFSYWFQEAGDEGVAFEQRIEYLTDSGALVFSQNSQFTMTRRTHSNIGRLDGFPIPAVAEGDRTANVRLLIKRVGGDDFRLAAEFPFTVTLTVASSSAVSH